jgi:hypothetical protein
VAQLEEHLAQMQQDLKLGKNCIFRFDMLRELGVTLSCQLFKVTP